MIAIQKARVYSVGSCNACDVEDNPRDLWVYEISLSHLIVRLCKHHFDEMVKLRKAVR